MIITGEDNIRFFRMLTLKQGLGLELKGLKMSRGKSMYAIIKQEFGLKGNKQKVYNQFSKLIEERRCQLNLYY